MVAVAVFLSIGCLGGNTARLEAADLNKEQLQRMYSDYLTEEGYKPTVDTDGDVVFKREGRTYFIDVDEKDLMFFRVVLPNFWKIESDEERAKVLAAADVSNRKSKVSKIHTVKDNTWCSTEIFIESPEKFRAIFNRTMSALNNGVSNFVVEMQK